MRLQAGMILPGLKMFCGSRAAFTARIGARPAYQRAMAKGDPGMELLLS